MIDYSKNSLLTNFGKTTLKDRYITKDEDCQDLFWRVAQTYADNSEHAGRLYEYISNLWFMPATPILSNGGTERGLPISCFLNETDDDLKSINQLWSENIWLAAKGGGIGSYWGSVRSIGEKISHSGYACGIMPFLKVMDSMTICISQGNLRRGSAAAYIDISHPEIEEFIDMRRPTGDSNRRCLNLHHGIAVTDKFMKAVEAGAPWDLISPLTNEVISTVAARELWIRLLTARVETGEPYILFIDKVNNATPDHHKELGLKVKMSNLCSEITLPTGKDYKGENRTAVCCLSSLNLEYFKEWEHNPYFIPDVIAFLDNVLEDFINKAPDEMARAKYSALMERSIGLGVMGFHSFLQKNMIPFESVVARSWNKRIFSHIKIIADRVNTELADLKGECPDSYYAREKNPELKPRRFSNMIAIAPTANISNICGSCSPGIEPYAANVFVQKTLSGSFTVTNKFLKNLLISKQKDSPEVWSSIASNEGSVQHLDFLTQDEKDIFKTSFELNQRWIIEHAADRTPFICQSQSLNLFLPSDINKKKLHQLHFEGWKAGIKSFYYCRSRSLQRADKVSDFKIEIDATNDEGCLSCQ